MGPWRSCQVSKFRDTFPLTGQCYNILDPFLIWSTNSTLALYTLTITISRNLLNLHSTCMSLDRWFVLQLVSYWLHGFLQLNSYWLHGSRCPWVGGIYDLVPPSPQLEWLGIFLTSFWEVFIPPPRIMENIANICPRQTWRISELFTHWSYTEEQNCICCQLWEYDHEIV